RARSSRGSRLPLPGLPGGGAVLPEALEQAQVPDRVHALPEPLVPKDGELTGRGQPFHHVRLEARAVAVEVGANARFEHQKSAVDPALAGLRLLGEARDEIAVED